MSNLMKITNNKIIMFTMGFCTTALSLILACFHLTKEGEKLTKASKSIM